MAADGEILNKPLLQRMANYLNLGGVRRSPGFLNMDDVKAVYVLGEEVQPVYSLGKSFVTPVDLGGDAGFTQWISGAVSLGTISQFYKNDNYALDLVGLDVKLTYTELGAAADNATVIALNLVRYERYGSYNQNIFYRNFYWQTIAAGRLNYFFGLSGFTKDTAFQSTSFTSLHIPRGDMFSLEIFRPSGGTFPTGTTIDIQAHAFTSELQPQEAYDQGS